MAPSSALKPERPSELELRRRVDLDRSSPLETVDEPDPGLGVAYRLDGP